MYNNTLHGLVHGDVLRHVTVSAGGRRLGRLRRHEGGEAGRGVVVSGEWRDAVHQLLDHRRQHVRTECYYFYFH